MQVKNVFKSFKRIFITNRCLVNKIDNTTWLTFLAHNIRNNHIGMYARVFDKPQMSI